MEGAGKKVIYFLGLFMIVFYLVIGGLLIFSDVFSDLFMGDSSPVIRYGIGILLLLYGIFRFWRAIKNNAKPI